MNLSWSIYLMIPQLRLSASSEPCVPHHEDLACRLPLKMLEKSSPKRDRSA